MKNKISDLRDHLFATLEALQDEDKPMEIDRARAIADVAKVVVDSAKAEVDYLKVTGQSMGTGFIALPETAGRPMLAAAPKDTPLRKCEHCLVSTAQTPCHHCGAAWERAA
jgi:hypothetical protein